MGLKRKSTWQKPGLTVNLLTPFLLPGASPIKQLGSRYSSSRHLPEAAPAINSTRLSNRDAASAISWKFQQAPKTRCWYFSLLRHSIRPLCSPDYFLDGPLTLAALFLFSAQLFPANRQYTATVRLSRVRLSPRQCARKSTRL